MAATDRQMRLWVQREFQTSGVALQPAALRALASLASESPDPEELMQALVEGVLELRAAGGPVVGVPAGLSALAAAAAGGPLSPAALDALVSRLQARGVAAVLGLRRGAPSEANGREGGSSARAPSGGGEGSTRADAGDRPKRARAAPPSLPEAAVVPLLETPALRWDPVRRSFHAAREPPRLLGTAAGKTGMFRGRYELVAQRVARNPLFRRTTFEVPRAGRGAPVDSAVLCDLRALAGRGPEEARCVLGFLTDLGGGRLALEDLSMRVPLDGLADADATDGYFALGSLALAAGALRPDGSFIVRELGQPPPERRAEALRAVGGLPAFGLERADLAPGRPGDLLVCLSDVRLDDPACLARLEAVLSGYEALDEPPGCLVLCGDFVARRPRRLDDGDLGARAGLAPREAGAEVGWGAGPPPGRAARTRAGFAQLAALLVRAAPRLARDAAIVLVPGPGDPGAGATLPRPPLPRQLVAPLAAVAGSLSLAPNPCRLRYGGREVVVFRHRMERLLRGLCVLSPEQLRRRARGRDGDENLGGPTDTPALASPAEGEVGGLGEAAESAERRLAVTAATLLQQAHLSPVPLEHQPVAWDLDHCLSLYPPPDLLVLADDTPAASVSFQGTSCASPGCLKHGTFAAYFAAPGEAQVCDVQPSQGPLEEGAAVGDEDGQAAAGDGEWEQLAVRAAEGVDREAEAMDNEPAGVAAERAANEDAGRARDTEDAFTGGSVGSAPSARENPVDAGPAGSDAGGSGSVSDADMGDPSEGSTRSAADSEADSAADSDADSDASVANSLASPPPSPRSTSPDEESPSERGLGADPEVSRDGLVTLE